MRTTRRDLFSGSAAAALLATIPQAKAASVKMLTATTRSLDVNGKAASVFALLGPDGKPGVTLYPGERFAMTLNNQTDKPTIIHWHGQLPDWKQDGFPWPQTPAIPAGMRKAYDYAPIPGTFWMHSHEGMQEQRLMAAPLIVHDEASILADTQEVVLMLHDFSFKTPEELLAGLTKKDGMTGGNMGSMGGMKMNAGGMGNMDMGSGGMTGGADLNDIDFDAYLANERTLRDPQIFRAAPGQVIRLRIINGASSTNFWIDLGQLSGKIIAVDGHDVAPVSGVRRRMI
jgi:FtsP/CotA-like multicopper oxidase with cupredoxin domain